MGSFNIHSNSVEDDFPEAPEMEDKDDNFVDLEKDEHLNSEYTAVSAQFEYSESGYVQGESDHADLDDLEAAHPYTKKWRTIVKRCSNRIGAAWEEYSYGFFVILLLLSTLVAFIWSIVSVLIDSVASYDARILAADRLKNAYLTLDQLGSTVEQLGSTMEQLGTTVEHVVERLDQLQGMGQNLTLTSGIEG